MGLVGVFPGTFNPVTVGHLAIADAAHAQHRLDRLDLVLSEAPLAKHGDADLAPLAARVALVQRALGDRPWATVRTTTDQLLTDIARGYDVVVMGGDKWSQIHDVSFYGGDPAARDAAMAALPIVAIAPRGNVAIPASSVLLVPDWVAEVSATAVRNGRTDWHGTPG
jgi:nicotinic acid mononucleotide adenylyltransferase